MYDGPVHLGNMLKVQVIVMLCFNLCSVKEHSCLQLQKCLQRDNELFTLCAQLEVSQYDCSLLRLLWLLSGSPGAVGSFVSRSRQLPHFFFPDLRALIRGSGIETF